MRRRVPKGLLALAVVAAGLVTLTPARGGVFQGDNGLIAYTCGSNICTFNPATSVTNPTFIASASDPSWSSDETEIAYVNGAGGISVADANGTNPVEIRTTPASKPTFSFDGDRVAYVKGNDIYSALSANGQAETQLTNTAANEADPAYSPTGTKIAYASDAGGGTYHIWTINSDGTGTAQQLTTGSGEQSPAWSPSGSTIVYSTVGAPHELFAFFGGSAHDLLVAGTDPAYSPDGTKIAFIDGSGRLVDVPATVPSTAPTPTVLVSGAPFAQPDWQALEFQSAPPPSSFTGPPVNTSYPTINLSFGDTEPILGDFVTASIGTWNGSFPITYAYQWKRCEPADPLNGSCFDIAGARSSFYTPVVADFGKRLRVQVTATNSQGNARQNSDVSAPVTADAPDLRDTPQITDNTPVVDSPLALTGGRWDGSSPLTFTYSWRRCNPVGDLATCVQIPGATLATYSPTVADISFSIRVWITGTNVAGSDVAVTNHTFPVIDKQHFSPSTVAAPAIAGTMTLGRQLTASIGSFDGDAPIGTSFVWQRCDATGAACHTILGAKKIVYHPTEADLGATLRLAVTAKNAYGTLVAMSDPSEPVLASPPHRRGRHIVGTRRGEYLAGGGYDDVILGMLGNDTLLGGAGADRLDGGPGNDVLTGGAGADRILGGAGSDTIYAADGERDVIDCGDGRDRAIVDSVDIVKNCEVVQQATSPSPNPNPPSIQTPNPGSSDTP